MSRPWLIAALAAFVLIAASPTSAQTVRSPRPYRGLFNGDAAATPGTGQQFGISGMLVTGYDDDLRADARGGNQPVASAKGQTSSGSVTTATGMGTYSLNNGGLSVSASGGGVARYYPSLPDEFVPYFMGSGTVAYSTKLWKNSTLGLAGTALYRPYLFDAVDLFIADGVSSGGPISDGELPYIADSYLVHSERVTLSQRLGPHTTVHGLYTYRGARNKGNDEGRFARQSYGGQLTHTLTQGLSLHAGYMRRDMQNEGAEIVPLHIIDVGASYNRALSFSRQTTLSFGTGTAAIRRNDALRFRVIGNVQLTHEIGRTWSAWAAYHRSVLESEVWLEPAEADGVAVGVGGLITRRLQFNFSGRGVLGKTGTQQDAPGFDGVRTTANLGYALNTSINLNAVYAYYHHTFDDATQLAIDLPPTTSRQSVRVGVTFWLPVFQSSRRADASR